MLVWMSWRSARPLAPFLESAFINEYLSLTILRMLSASSSRSSRSFSSIYFYNYSKLSSISLYKSARYSNLSNLLDFFLKYFLEIPCFFDILSTSALSTLASKTAYPIMATKAITKKNGVMQWVHPPNRYITLKLGLMPSALRFSDVSGQLVLPLHSFLASALVLPSPSTTLTIIYAVFGDLLSPKTKTPG